MSGFSISGWASAPAAASFWLALGQQPLQRFLEGSVLLRLPFGAAPQPAAACRIFLAVCRASSSASMLSGEYRMPS